MYRRGYTQNRQYASKAEYIEFMRSFQSAVVTATQTEEEVDVPISRSYGSNRALAIAIHWIEYHQNVSLVVGDGFSSLWSVCKKTKAAVANPCDDPDCIDACSLHTDLATNGATSISTPIIHKFDKPYLLGNNKIYVQYYHNRATNTAMGVRIAFSPRFVSDNQLMEALID